MELIKYLKINITRRLWIMRTLYVRIIAMTIMIMIASTFIAFIVSNVYYQYYLKPENDQKVTEIAEDIVTVFEASDGEDISTYLTAMTNLGYIFYLIDPYDNGETYGEPFRLYNLEHNQIEQVLEGDIYHGIANLPRKVFVTGFFNNELRNTVGIPIEINGETHALFVRPNTAQQFGEMRIFLALLLVFSLIFSFILVLMSTRLIVNPIQKLIEATKKIAAGNYHIKLNVNQRDEIGILASDFSKMSDRLEQVEEKRQEFVSNVSHEIQSPLTSIQGFSQALREQSLTKEERIRYLSIIEKESRRLSLLSKQLLTLSVLDSEIDHDQKLTFNLSDQLNEVISSVEWQLEEKEIVIEMDITIENIFGDPKLLHQVWLNLLTNAIRYNRLGGTISIRTIDRRDSVDIIFEDTGVGIAEEDISQLFDRFYKADKARTRTKSSTGLGLSIVKKIIELHHGTIMVQSELDKGSMFTVTLSKQQSN